MTQTPQDSNESELRKQLRMWLKEISRELPKNREFHIVLIGYSVLIFHKELVVERATEDIDAFFDGEDGHQMFQEVTQALGFDEDFEILEYKFVELGLSRIPDYRSRMTPFMLVEQIHVHQLADVDVLILKLHANRKKDRVDLHFLFQHNPTTTEQVKELLLRHNQLELLQRMDDILSQLGT
jgi:hypothetical protein